MTVSLLELLVAAKKKKKKNNDFNGHLVPTDYVCGDKVFPSDYVGGKASNARAKNSKFET